MMMPMVVFAGTYTVNNWDEYKEKLKEDIMKQEASIIINYSGSEIFSTEYFARLKIADIYEEAKEELPKYYGELNIISQTTLPVLDGNLNTSLKSVTHTIKYKNSAKDFAEIRTILNEEYKTIKTKVTDYEKIKAAYDYVVCELKKDEDASSIKKILSSQGDNSYTFLFSMMMTDLGYDNDIANGTDGNKWNLVKVQGKWYHVDGRLETIGEDNVVKDNLFLISKNESGDWDKDEHEGKLLADTKYDGNPPTVPQLKYEIEIIEEEIKGTLNEIINISEEISMEQIRETKRKFEAIEEKVKNYGERKNILEPEINKELDESLKVTFNELVKNIDKVQCEINNKKSEIINKTVKKAEDTFEMADILAAKEAITMIEDKELEEKINALEVAIGAIEKAERTKLEGDITLAKEAIKNTKITGYKIRLEERIKVLEATIAVEKVEITKIQEDIDIAIGLIGELVEGVTRINLENRIKAINDEIAANIAEQRRINEAKAVVDKAEAALKNNETIDDIKGETENAEKAIEKIETDSVKEQLQARINHINIAIVAIETIEKAEKSVEDIPNEESLAVVIETAEGNIKTAEIEVKKIKDRDVRSNQQNRIKAIQLVVTAMKAVEKAETSTPLKMINVTSARKAIDKINEKYQDTIDDLDVRVNKVEYTIMLENKETSAIKAVEKAEKSMKDIDIALARDAVDLLSDNDIKIQLNNRIDAINNINKLENSLAKYVEELSEEYRLELNIAIRDVDKAIEKLEEGNIKTKYKSRLSVARKTRTAIDKIKLAKDDYTIKVADDAIAEVTDSRIKEVLEKKLKDIVLQKEIDRKIEEATEAVEKAKENVKEIMEANENLEAVNNAEEEVKQLPTGSVKKELQTIIKELNNVIKAKQIVENAEVKLDNGILTIKDVTTSEKAVWGLNKEYREYNPGKDEQGEDNPNLNERIKALRTALEEKEANELLKKAEEAVAKAKETKSTRDITVGKKAVSLVKNEEKKKELTAQIEELEVSIAEEAVKKAEESARYNSKSTSKDITAAEKMVDGISNRNKYEKEISNLNARIKAMKSYQEAIKVLEDTKKNRNEQNKEAAQRALDEFGRDAQKVKEKDEDVYKDVYEKMETYIKDEIGAIEEYLADEEQKVEDANTAVKNAEDKMKVESNPSNDDIKNAQETIHKVSDRTKKAALQKRLDAVTAAMAAKSAVERAEAYTDSSSLKEAEKALNNLTRTNSYLNIIKDLGNRIAKLNDKLNVSKKVDEATKLVQKAIDSRKEADIAKAKFAVDSLESLGLDAHNGLREAHKRLTEMLETLDASIGEEAKNESDALKAAQDKINKAITEIDEVNIYIGNIIEGEDREDKKIQEVYDKIQLAKNHIIKANAETRKLTKQNQKGLLAQIDNANREIELAEDNVHVKEAVRLVTIASSSVTNSKDEHDKAKARLDIAAARRATDKIRHNNNKAVKATISKTLDSIQNKLTSDNDRELIDAAVDAVNKAADMLAKAVRNNKVMDEQEEIEKAIFSAKLAIGWISDNNKAAKATLTNFINDIESMFKSEKEGILNEERIKNAEKAVVEAESKKGSEELENYIRTARLRVRLIKNDGPETAAKIADLNARLDALEGKNNGGSGSSGNNKPGGNSGDSNKKGGSSGGNIIPTSPLSDYERVIGTTEPVWGRTKKLKKTNPITGISVYDMTIFKIHDSRAKIMELSNILNTKPNVNAKLIVNGKTIDPDSQPYIYDRTNNSVLLPIRFLSDELGFTISLTDSPVKNRVKRLLLTGIVNGETKSIIMDIGSEYCYVNGSLVKMSSKTVIQDGRTYIPVDFMVEYLGLTFSYYKESGNIQLIIN